MNVLILGGRGMAGHMLAAYWRHATDDRLTVTVRGASDGQRTAGIGDELQRAGIGDGRQRAGIGDGRQRAGIGEEPAENAVGAGFRYRRFARYAEPALEGRNPLPDGVTACELDVREGAAVERVVKQVRPDLIVNATGVLNADADRSPHDAYYINGLLPHWLAHLADGIGARLFHISSDCVFLGDKGRYRVDDATTGNTVYARTKVLGEVRQQRHLTLRTSIIGPDVRARGIGLMRWFLAQDGRVPGYRQVFWNGVTTLELAKAALWYAHRPDVGGIVHLISSECVSKYELLLMMQQAFGVTGVDIVPQDEPRQDRTLAASGYGDAVYRAPNYETMLVELRDWMNGR